MFDPLHRRDFLVRSAAAVAASQLPFSALAAGQRAIADLLQYVDPALLEPASTLLDSQNAYPLLASAAKRLTEMPDGDWELEDCFGSKVPDPQRDRLLSDWLDQHEPAFELVCQGVARNKLDRPREPWTYERLESNMRTLAYFLQLRTQRLLSQKRCEQAVESASQMLAAFQLLMDGGGVLVEYLIACTCQFSCWKLLTRIAATPGVSNELCRALLKEISNRPPASDSLRRVIRAEYSQFLLPELIKAKSPDVARTFRSLAPWTEAYAQFEGYPNREQYEILCKQFASLFEGHPQPYDLVDTVKRTSALYMGYFDDLKRPWNPGRQHEVQVPDKELAAWPKGLRLSEFGLAGTPAGASDEEIRKARVQLRKVANPIGRQLVDSHTVDSASLCRARLSVSARYDGTRLCLAANVYAREHGKLPQRLDDLVAKKLVPVVPVDTFSSRPFLYSRDQRAIWSVGPNGDVSPSASDEVFDRDDYLWTIPVI